MGKPISKKEFNGQIQDSTNVVVNKSKEFLGGVNGNSIKVFGDDTPNPKTIKLVFIKNVLEKIKSSQKL